MKRRATGAVVDGGGGGDAGSAKKAFKTPRLKVAGSGDGKAASQLRNGLAEATEFLAVLYDRVNGWFPLISANVTSPDCPTGVIQDQDRARRLNIRIGNQDWKGYILAKVDPGADWQRAQRTVENYIEGYVAEGRHEEEGLDERQAAHMTRGFPPVIGADQPYQFNPIGTRPLGGPIFLRPARVGSKEGKRRARGNTAAKAKSKRGGSSAPPPPSPPPPTPPPPSQPPPPSGGKGSDSESESEGEKKEEEDVAPEDQAAAVLEEWVAKLDHLTNAENHWRNDQQRLAAQERLTRILGLVGDGRMAEAQADYDSFCVQNEEEREAAGRGTEEEQIFNALQSSIALGGFGGGAGNNDDDFSFSVNGDVGLEAAAVAADTLNTGALLNTAALEIQTKRRVVAPPGRVKRSGNQQPGEESDLLAEGGPGPQADEMMVDVNTVNWSHYDYVVKVGESNALAYQLTRGGNVFGRPATNSGPGDDELSLIDQLNELEGKITDPQMRLLDQANQLRFRILDLKIQQTLLHAAHNSDAADELRMGGRRREGADRTGARMAAILPADNEKARALKTQLGIPFSKLPSFEKGFGAEAGKMEALWELKLGLEAASKESVKNLITEIVDPDTLNRMIWTAANGTQPEPELDKETTRRLGIPLSKISNNFMTFVLRFVKRQKTYEGLKSEQERRDMVSDYSDAVKSMVNNKRQTRLNERRKMCYEWVRGGDSSGKDWRVALLFLLDDQALGGKHLNGKRWPRSSDRGEVERFLHTYYSKVEGDTLAELVKASPGLEGKSIEEIGPERVVKLVLNKKLRRSWAPTNQDLQDKARDAARKRERRRVATEERKSKARRGEKELETEDEDEVAQVEVESVDVSQSNQEEVRTPRKSGRMRRQKNKLDL